MVWRPVGAHGLAAGGWAAGGWLSLSPCSPPFAPRQGSGCRRCRRSISAALPPLWPRRSASPIGLGLAQRPGSAIVTPIIDTLQTIPSFCFIIPGRHAVPGRRCDGADRHRRLRHRAGDALHQSRHPAGAARIDRGGHRSGCTNWQFFRRCSFRWRCRRSCWASTRRSFLRSA